MSRRQTTAMLISLLLIGLVAAGAVGPAAAQSGTGLEYEGDTLTLKPAAGQTISGTTDLESGSKLSIQLRASGSSPFIKAKSATVTDSGTFEASFNFSEIPAGTEFTVRVIHDDEELTTEKGRVVDVTETTTITSTGDAETTAKSGVPLTAISVLAGLLMLTFGGFLLYSRFEE